VTTALSPFALIPAKFKLTRSGGSVQQHTLGRLDSQRLEESRVAQRQLDHLANHGQLLAHASEIVVANLQKDQTRKHG